jgi:triphosphoribosyl-dephospho-CoA synthase
LEREVIADTISRCVELACLLEVSAYPKPGNVHRTRDISGTSYEQFLAGSIAIGPAFRNLAQRGYDLKMGKIYWGDINIGEHIFDAVKDMLNWQKGGNINLGIILLFAPLTISAGYSIKDNKVDINELRNNLEKILEATTPIDVSYLYKSINLCMSDKTLGKVERYDLRNASSIEQIKEKNLSVLDIFQQCADKDNICYEWISNFQISFTQGYPYLSKALLNASINDSILNTYLYLLSEYPDSLIQRKKGKDMALKISEKASKILERGGAFSKKGREMIIVFDRKLHESDGGLNPGTTADLTAAAIYVVLLTGWRP